VQSLCTLRPPLSLGATQRSLPGGRYLLLGPVSDRLDRASLPDALIRSPRRRGRAAPKKWGCQAILCCRGARRGHEEAQHSKCHLRARRFIEPSHRVWRRIPQFPPWGAQRPVGVKGRSRIWAIAILIYPAKRTSWRRAPRWSPVGHQETFVKQHVTSKIETRYRPSLSGHGFDFSE